MFLTLRIALCPLDADSLTISLNAAVVTQAAWHDPWVDQDMLEDTARDEAVPMKRRVFLIEAGKAFPVVAGALYVIGCGSSPTEPSAVADISSVSTVVNAHTHTVGVTASDQLHPATKTYTSSAAAAHEHMVTLTTDQLSTLGSGGSVTVTSTNSTVTGNHTHEFTFQGKKS